jgi:small-conductance mechanosensitive channel
MIALAELLAQIAQKTPALPTIPPRFWIRLLAAVIIVALVYGVYILIVRMIRGLRERGRLSEHTHRILRRICYWTAVVVGTLLVLERFGLMDNAWTTLTALLAMVAIGFVAVWSVLSNTFCSIVLMIARPFNVGDTIEVTGDGLRGRVIDFNLIYTTLRDADGSLLLVPNNTFFQKTIRRIVGTETRTLEQQADREQPME